MSVTEVNAPKSPSSAILDSHSPSPACAKPCYHAGPVVPSHQRYLPLKFLGEYILASLLFLISLPILLVAAIAIKVTSTGPVFYLQTRVGKRGKLFRVIKLRTMIQNAEGKTGPVWSSINDPRITPIGKFLRDSHIDEFPQLINVLLGQMALVGPRPERPEIVRELEWKIPNYSERSNVRPGITGLSQLKLPPDTDLDSVRRKQLFDLYYVTHVSLWLDLRILGSTAWLLLSAIGHGALSVFALPQSTAVVSKIESIVGPDSELVLAHRDLPPK